MRDFVAGKLEPHIKSEPVPEPNDDPVKVTYSLNVAASFLVYVHFFLI